MELDTFVGIDPSKYIHTTKIYAIPFHFIFTERERQREMFLVRVFVFHPTARINCLCVSVRLLCYSMLTVFPFSFSLVNFEFFYTSHGACTHATIFILLFVEIKYAFTQLLLYHISLVTMFSQKAFRKLSQRYCCNRHSKSGTKVCMCVCFIHLYIETWNHHSAATNVVSLFDFHHLKLNTSAIFGDGDGENGFTSEKKL